MIECLNDSVSTDSQHVFSGNEPFYFEVEARDADNSITQVLINGTPSDTCDVENSRTWRCTRVFSQLPPEGDSLTIVVVASDSKQNVARDTFQVFYDSTLVLKPTIVVSSPRDSARVSERTVYVDGHVDYLYDYDSLFMTLLVNGVPRPEKVVKPGDNSWSWQAPFTTDTGRLELLLENRYGSGPDAGKDTLDAALRLVLYDASLVDTVGPSIVGVETPAGTEIVAEPPFVSGQTPLALVLTVTDALSGVDSVKVDGVLAVSAGDGRWTVSVGITHVRDGSVLDIEAWDSRANRGVDSRTVYLNTPPVIDTVPNGPEFATVGEPYTTNSLSVRDDDGDSLSVLLVFRTPADSHYVYLDSAGAFAWVPDSADTGAVVVDVVADDHYPLGIAEESFDLYVQLPDDTTTVRARFITTAAAFPESLVAGVDSMAVALQIDQPLGSGNYLFSATLATTGEELLNSPADTVVRWTPGLQDTGTHALRVVVTSGPGLADSIVPAPVIRVVAPPSPVEVRFVNGQSSVSESVGVTQIPVSLSRSSGDSVVVTYRVQQASGGTTADTSDYRLPSPQRLAFSAGDTLADIALTIVEDSTVEPTEKLTLVLDSIISVDTTRRVSPFTHICYIADNDTAARIDTVTFTAGDSGAYEGDYTVSVGVGLSSPASKPVRLLVETSGSAKQGVDYTVWPVDITLHEGATDTTVFLTILDDHECETTESIALRLQKRTPGTVLLDSVYSFGILDNDSMACLQTVLFVHAEQHLLENENTMIGELMGLGYAVEKVFVGDANYVNFEDYNGIVLSSTLTYGWFASNLADVAVPILSLSWPSWVTLGLVSAYDTTSAYGNHLRLLVQTPVGGPGDLVPVTETLVYLPWVRIRNGGQVIASAVPYEDLRDSSMIPIQPLDTFASVFTLAPASAGTGDVVVPARRCGLMSGRTHYGSGEVFYTSEFWVLFRQCAMWTVTGSGFGNQIQ